MANAKYINLYANQAGYDAETHKVNGDEVSLIEDVNKVVYDGVNVEVPRSSVKVGTLVYADATGAVHFIDGATAKAASISSGWELVGVVALRRGNKAKVLYKSETSVRFTSCWAWEVTGLTYGSEQSIVFQQVTKTDPYSKVTVGTCTFTPSDIDDAVSKIDTWLRANPGDTSTCYEYNWHCAKIDGGIWVIADLGSSPNYRQYTTLHGSGTTSGIATNTNMWSLGGFDVNNNVITRNDGVNSGNYSIWNKDAVRVMNIDQGSPADEVGHDGYFSETNFNNSTVLKAYYGTYDNYCKALMPKYPCATDAMGKYAGHGKANCDNMDSVTYVPKDGGNAVNMFSAAHWAKTQKAHSTASVDGMNAGDWYIPGFDEIVDIFSSMKVDGSDAIHQAFANAGLSSAYPISPSANAYRWVPARYYNNLTWLFSTYGSIANFGRYGYLYDYARAVAVAEVEL